VAWKPSNRLAAYGSALPINDGSLNAEEEQRILQEWHERQEARSKEGTAGEWETVTPVPSRSSNAEAANSVAGSSSEQDLVKSYKFKEKQGHYREHDVDDEGAEIKVKKRVKVHSETEKLKQIEEDKKKMMPNWRPMKFDTGISAKVEDVQLVPVEERREAQEVDLAGAEDTETREKPQPLPSAPLPEPAASSTAPMFKKRKSGAGAGAKRVRAVI
jgi:WW domain-binding protein 4